MTSFGNGLLVAVLAVSPGGYDGSLVLGASAVVRPRSLVRPWSFVAGPPDQGPRTVGRTEDQGRTKHQAPSAKDQAEAPWFGIWQQIPPASKWFNLSPYKKVTLRIEPWEDGLKVTYDMVRRRGGITHLEWAGRFDGRDYPVQGVDYVLTNAYRQLSDRSYEIVISVDGRRVAIATSVISTDGNRLTVDTVETDARGQTVKSSAAYVRQ